MRADKLSMLDSEFRPRVLDKSSLEMTCLFLPCYSPMRRTRRAAGWKTARSRERPQYSCLPLNLWYTFFVR